MIGGHRWRVMWFMVAAAALAGGPILVFGMHSIAGIAAAFGSTAIALVVLAHLGVLAVMIAPLREWWRRPGR